MTIPEKMALKLIYFLGADFDNVFTSKNSFFNMSQHAWSSENNIFTMVFNDFCFFDDKPRSEKTKIRKLTENIKQIGLQTSEGLTSTTQNTREAAMILKEPLCLYEIGPTAERRR